MITGNLNIFKLHFIVFFWSPRQPVGRKIYTDMNDGGFIGKITALKNQL